MSQKESLMCTTSYQLQCLSRRQKVRFLLKSLLLMNKESVLLGTMNQKYYLRDFLKVCLTYHISPTHTLPFKNTESIVVNNMMGSLNAFSPRPKIKLPNFDGVNPRGWVKKCHKYFTIFAIADHQKLELASMYLVGK